MNESITAEVQMFLLNTEADLPKELSKTHISIPGSKAITKQNMSGLT